jgi:hypothetical protein
MSIGSTVICPPPRFQSQNRDTYGGEDNGAPESPPAASFPGRSRPRLMKYNAGGALRYRLRRHLKSLLAQKPRALAEQESAQFAGIEHVFRREERLIVLVRVIMNRLGCSFQRASVRRLTPQAAAISRSDLSAVRYEQSCPMFLPARYGCARRGGRWLILGSLPLPYRFRCRL